MKVQYNVVDARSPQLKGRIPYKITIAENGIPLFKWIFVGDKKFTEPFFEESISYCLSLPQNSNMPFTTAETLLQKASSVETVEPSAFIFHISRCGSTLLAQMLSIDERFIVLSEVPLLDELLRIPFSQNAKNISNGNVLFKAVLCLLGEKRSGKEKYLFVKTDSWHLLFFETIRQLFPHVPAFLLYRSPKEVIRSQQKFRGMHAVPGPIQPEIFGFTQERIAKLLPDEYFEIVLESYFTKCLEIVRADNRTRTLSYHDGAMEMLRSIIGLCGIPMDPEMLARMEKRTTHHSKHPENEFTVESTLPETAHKTESEKLFGQLDAERKIRSMLNQ